jgi:hypothetical protein
MKQWKILSVLVQILCLPWAFGSISQYLAYQSDGNINRVSNFELPNKMKVAIFQSPLVSKTSIFISHPFSRMDEEFPGLVSFYLTLAILGNDSLVNNPLLGNFYLTMSHGYFQGVGVQFNFSSPPLKEEFKQVASIFFDSKFYNKEITEKEITKGLENFKKSQNRDNLRTIDFMAGQIQGPHFSNYYANSFHTSLCKVKKDRLIKALRKLHERKLSSSLMKLIILTPKPISEIQEYVIKYFSSIPYRPGVVMKTTEFIHSKAIEFNSQNGNTLLIQLPISFDKNFPHHLRLFEYFIYLLGSKTRGTWLHQLRGEIYSDHVDIKFEMFGERLCVINIFLNFFPSIRNTIIKKVVTTFHQYFNFLQKHAADEGLYNEFRANLKRKMAQSLLDSVLIAKFPEQMHYNQRIYDWFSCGELVFDADLISQFFLKIDPTLINIISGWKKPNEDDSDDSSSELTFLQAPNNYNLLLLKEKEYKPRLPFENRYSSYTELSFMPLSDSCEKYASPIFLKPFLGFRNQFPAQSSEAMFLIRLFILDETYLRNRIMLGSFFEIIKNHHLFIEIDQAQKAGVKIDIKLSNFQSIDISIHGLEARPAKRFLCRFLKAVKSFAEQDLNSWDTWKSLFEGTKHLLIPVPNSPPNSVILQFLDRQISNDDQKVTIKAIKALINEISFEDFVKFFISENQLEKCFSSPRVYVAGSSLNKIYAQRIHNLITNVFKDKESDGSACFHKDQVLLPIYLVKERFYMRPEPSIFSNHNVAFSLAFCHVFSDLFLEKLTPKENWGSPPRLTIGISHDKIELYFYLDSVAPKEKLIDYTINFLKQDVPVYLNSMSDAKLRKIFISLKQMLLKSDDDFYTIVRNQWFSMTTFNLNHRNSYNYFVDQKTFRLDVANFIAQKTS